MKVDIWFLITMAAVCFIACLVADFVFMELIKAWLQTKLNSIGL